MVLSELNNAMTMLTYRATFEYNRNGTSNASVYTLTACRGLRPLTPDEPFGPCGSLTTQNVPPTVGTPARCARPKCGCFNSKLLRKEWW